MNLKMFLRSMANAQILRSSKRKVLVPFLSANLVRFALLNKVVKSRGDVLSFLEQPDGFLGSGRLRGLCLLCLRVFKSIFFYLLGKYDHGQAVKVFWEKGGGGSQLSFEVVPLHTYMFVQYR